LKELIDSSMMKNKQSSNKEGEEGKWITIANSVSRQPRPQKKKEARGDNLQSDGQFNGLKG
jgi:hypothetical protein